MEYKLPNCQEHIDWLPSLSAFLTPVVIQQVPITSGYRATVQAASKYTSNQDE